MIFAWGEAPDLITADVAVVGAGPAGLALALSLSRAGLEVAILESGLAHGDAWANDLSAAESVEPPEHPAVELTTERRVGGASWIWGGRCVDYEPFDFEADRVGEAAGWPISYEEATSHAAGAAQFLGIGRPVFDEALPWAEGGGSLTARLERWCAIPQLMRLYEREIRSNPKARLYPGLTCVGVSLDACGGRVDRLRVRDRSGVERAVRARHYVLAAGGIGTARLLLASDDVESAGVGGRSGWLGRGYMGHLKGAIADIVLTGLDEAQVDYRRHGDGYVRPRLMLRPEALRAGRLNNIAFLPDNPILADWSHRSGVLSAAALALSTPGLGPMLLGSGPIRTLLLGREVTRGDIAPHLANVLRDVPGVGAFVARFLPRRFGRPRVPGAFVRNRARRYLLKYSAEHTPLRESRVVLSQALDETGLRRISVRQTVSQADVESVLRSHELLDAELRLRGLGRLEYLGGRAQMSEAIRRSAADGYHQIGLTRMSRLAADGVVDPDCRVHGVANLYVAGPSVLPTSGQANPTYMAICLALRLAGRLAIQT